MRKSNSIYKSILYKIQIISLKIKERALEARMFKNKIQRNEETIEEKEAATVDRIPGSFPIENRNCRHEYRKISRAFETRHRRRRRRMAVPPAVCQERWSNSELTHSAIAGMTSGRTWQHNAARGSRPSPCILPRDVYTRQQEATVLFLPILSS